MRLIAQRFENGCRRPVVPSATAPAMLATSEGAAGPEVMYEGKKRKHILKRAFRCSLGDRPRLGVSGWAHLAERASATKSPNGSGAAFAYMNDRCPETTVNDLVSMTEVNRLGD